MSQNTYLHTAYKSVSYSKPDSRLALDKRGSCTSGKQTYPSILSHQGLTWCHTWWFFLSSNQSLQRASVCRYIHCYADNLIPELPTKAHSCSRHGPAAASLPSARPGNVTSVLETSTLLGVEVHCLSSSQRSTVPLIISLCYELLCLKCWTLQLVPVLTRHRRVLTVITQCFWNGEKTVGAARAVLPPPPPPFPHTRALKGIKLPNEHSTYVYCTHR
jgi:hypothetical protein